VANDFLGIAEAIATKARAIAGIKLSTHEVPDGLTKTPALIVFPPEGDVEEPMSQEVVTSTFTGFLYLARPADTGRTLLKVYPFINLFLVAWRSGRVLGMAGYVQDSWIASWRLDDFADYGGTYLGYEFKWGVRTRENVSRSS
jgi:hypothetical protein